MAWQPPPGGMPGMHPGMMPPGVPMPGMMPGMPPFPGAPGFPPAPGFAPGPPMMAPFPGAPMMQPFGGAGVPPRLALWQTLQTPEGRTYYFNPGTGQTTWEKPEELKTPFEKAIGALPWKETTDQKSGRKYYYNSETKKTVWQMPDEMKELYDKKERGELPDELPTPGPDAMSPMMGAGMSPADRVSTPRPEEKKEEDNIPQFETREEAEEAFINMLKEQNVPAHLSWEQAMPRIVAFPMYRALKTLLERKQAFTRYAEDRRRTEREEQRARYTRDRETFRSMLSAIPEIKAGVKYRKALRWIRDKPEYISVASEKERQDFYEEYVEELRRAEMDQQRALRKRNVEKFRGILAKRGVTVSTRWKEAQAMYLEAPEYLEDEELKKMEPVDFLATFEDHIKALEEVESETKRRAENMRRRDERVKREAFWGLLQGLVEQGLLSTATKWKDIYPVIREDPRYLDMLGQPGSNPLEMFWDIQYDMEERFQTERKLVTDMMRSLNIVVNTDTSFTIFLAQFSDERINTVDKSILRMVFDEQMAKAEGRVKEEKRREERRLRKKLDSLKQALKKLDPPVTAESTWTEIQPRVAGKADVEGVSEEMQVEVFEKLRKKIEDKAPDSEEEGEEREKEERRKRRDRSEERGKRERSRSRDKRSRDRGREDRDRDRKSRRRHSRDRSVSEDERERERRKRRKEDPNDEIEEGEIV